MLEFAAGEIVRTLKFNNIERYEEYLKEMFPSLAQDREYNIFIHCVTNNTNYFIERPKTIDEDVKRKIEGIMEHGLNLDGAQDYGNYGSINGTAKFFGNSKKVDVGKIINYDFFSRTSKVNSILIAIPKYINVYGELVEFSSYKGVMKHSSQHIKDCLFDLVKEHFLPVEFILGHQMINNKTGEVTFNLNDNHISFLSEECKINLLQKMQKKCEHILEYCKNRYGVYEYEDVFKIMTKEHMFVIDDFLNQP